MTNFANGKKYVKYLAATSNAFNALASSVMFFMPCAPNAPYQSDLHALCLLQHSYARGSEIRASVASCRILSSAAVYLTRRHIITFARVAFVYPHNDGRAVTKWFFWTRANGMQGVPWHMQCTCYRPSGENSSIVESPDASAWRTGYNVRGRVLFTGYIQHLDMRARCAMHCIDTKRKLQLLHNVKRIQFSFAKSFTVLRFFSFQWTFPTKFE